MNFKLLPMTEADLPAFKSDIQEAFQKGFEDVYGKTDDIILPKKDIDRSLNAEGSAAYKAVVDGETVGGATDEKAIEALKHSFTKYEVTEEAKCGVAGKKVAVCDHLCHKSGIMGFFWKIIKFFSKLFKINPVCECGATHY